MLIGLLITLIFSQIVSGSVFITIYEPESESITIVPEFVPLYLYSTADVTGTVTFTCYTTNPSIITYTQTLNSIATNTDYNVTYTDDAIGICKFTCSFTASNNPSRTFYLVYPVIVDIPASMIVGESYEVYANSTSPTATTEAYTMTLNCDTSSQDFSGYYNVSNTLSVNTDLTSGPCTMTIIPVSGFFEYIVVNTNVSSALTFTNVSPNPIVAGNNLNLTVSTSDSISIPIYITLNCSDFGSDSDLMVYTVSGDANEPTQLFIPSYFYGNCSLTSEPIDPDLSTLYLQATDQSVEVDSYFYWVNPANSSAVTAGQPMSVLINSSSSSPAIVAIFYIQDSITRFLLTSFTNSTFTLTVPRTYPRGSAEFLANTTIPFYYPEATSIIFVSTRVSLASPSNDSIFAQNSPIPVQLVAADSQDATGSVQMTCTGNYISIKPVQSTSITYFTSPTGGTCSFAIISLSSDYTVTAPYSTIQTTIVGPIYFLTPQQSAAFAISLSFKPDDYYFNSPDRFPFLLSK